MGSIDLPERGEIVVAGVNDRYYGQNGYPNYLGDSPETGIDLLDNTFTITRYRASDGERLSVAHLTGLDFLRIYSGRRDILELHLNYLDDEEPQISVNGVARSLPRERPQPGSICSSTGILTPSRAPSASSPAMCRIRLTPGSQNLAAHMPVKVGISGPWRLVSGWATLLPRKMAPTSFTQSDSEPIRKLPRLSWRVDLGDNTQMVGVMLGPTFSDDDLSWMGYSQNELSEMIGEGYYRLFCTY